MKNEKLHSLLTSYFKIPDKEWDLFESRLSTMSLKKGEFFIREGEIPDRFGFIVSGLFRVFYTTEDGEERVIVFREENKFITAFSAFLENRESRISLQAIEDSQLIIISTSEFRKIISRDVSWDIIIGKITQEIFLEKEKREQEFLSDDAFTRYTKFLEKYPGFEERISQYNIASYLGISPVTLSRLRNRS